MKSQLIDLSCGRDSNDRVLNSLYIAPGAACPNTMKLSASPTFGLSDYVSSML